MLQQFSIGLRSWEDGGHTMSFSPFMPIVASDAEVFLAARDGAFLSMKIILLQKAWFSFCTMEESGQSIEGLCITASLWRILHLHSRGTSSFKYLFAALWWHFSSCSLNPMKPSSLWLYLHEPVCALNQPQTVPWSRFGFHGIFKVFLPCPKHSTISRFSAIERTFFFPILPENVGLLNNVERPSSVVFPFFSWDQFKLIITGVWDWFQWSKEPWDTIPSTSWIEKPPKLSLCTLNTICIIIWNRVYSNESRGVCVSVLKFVYHCIR